MRGGEIQYAFARKSVGVHCKRCLVGETVDMPDSFTLSLCYFGYKLRYHTQTCSVWPRSAATLSQCSSVPSVKKFMWRFMLSRACCASSCLTCNHVADETVLFIVACWGAKKLEWAAGKEQVRWLGFMETLPCGSCLLVSGLLLVMPRRVWYMKQSCH